MSKLISGWEAIKAVESGECVEYQKLSSKWYSLNDEPGKWVITDFTNGSYKFRLKPRTITINGIEVPAPFEPKNGEKYFVIFPSFQSGFAEFTADYSIKYTDSGLCKFGAWRTEEEIKQVVAALRQVFKGEQA